MKRSVAMVFWIAAMSGVTAVLFSLSSLWGWPGQTTVYALCAFAVGMSVSSLILIRGYDRDEYTRMREDILRQKKIARTSDTSEVGG